MDFLTLSNVTARYGKASVLHGVTFGVEEGKISVLLGANGAGKTTVLRSISRTVATYGDLRLDGTDISRSSPEAVVRMGVGHVPQGRGTFEQLSVIDNLRLGGYSRSKAEVASDVDTWLEYFPRLRKWVNRPAASLSGGEQQMLAVARGLMLKPRLLLLDEPSLGLAPIVTESLFETLVQINESHAMTMLVVEQNAKLALKHAAAAYVLETGRIVSAGPAHTMADDVTLRKAYLGY
jgi:branched-chain amino acid transport system ATP-binding protein